MPAATVEINGRQTVSEAARQAGDAVVDMSERSKTAFSGITVTAAMAQSSQITREQAAALAQYAEAQASRTGADDEAVLGMVSFLATAGRTDEQIRALISAASDMSIVTGKDLRTSVEELN